MTGHFAQALQDGLLATAPDIRPAGPESMRRRRMVVAITVVVGGVLLGLSLGVRPGDTAFYPLSAATAVVWLVGGLLSGPLRLGRTAGRRPILLPLAIGVIAAGTFVLGALVVRDIGPLARLTQQVLDFARQGNLPVVLAVTAVSGVGEEVFFRGAVYSAAAGWHPVAVSTVAYTLTTFATGNLMLVFAAAVMGTILGLQRRASGGLMAPIITHLTWSLTMAIVLPPLFGPI